MREKTRIAAVGGVSTGSGKSERIGRALRPCCQDTTTVQGTQGLISKFLLKGSENALLMRDLQRLTGMTAREVRLHIARERAAGVPILTQQGRGGYFLPDTGEKGRRELRLFVGLMHSIGRNTLRAADPAKRLLEQVAGQEVIGGVLHGE